MNKNKEPGSTKNTEKTSDTPYDTLPKEQSLKKPSKAQIELSKKLHESYVEKLPVIILTDKFRIKCKINLLRGVRLTDFIRTERDFIPVLEAEVWSLENPQKIISTEFLNISKSHIQIITPDDLVETKPKDFDIPDTIGSKRSKNPF